MLSVEFPVTSFSSLFSKKENNMPRYTNQRSSVKSRAPYSRGGYVSGAVRRDAIVAASRAKASTASVAELQSQLNRLKRSVAKKDEEHYLTYSLVNNSVIRDYVAVNLSNFSTASGTITTGPGSSTNPPAALSFGTTAADLACNRLTDKMIEFKAKFQATGTEPDNITYSVFVVSLKDDANDGNLFDPLNGELTMTADKEYTKSPTSGALSLVLLNPKVFKIHKQWQFTIGNNGVSPSTATAQQGMLTQKTIEFKKKLGWDIINPIGDVWQQCQSARDPSKQMYLLIFNDDTYLDVQAQRYDFNMVRTVIPRT